MRKKIKLSALIGVSLLLAGGVAQAQRKTKKELAGYDRAARATVVHPAIVYVAAEDNASHLSEVLPGHEVVVMEHNGAWVRVFANTDVADEQGEGDKPEFSTDEDATPESGWIKDKGLVNSTTPNGDAVLFGTAANFEAMASQPHAPKDAAEEAHLLYRRVTEYFPTSPLAPEAAYRSADVRWQIDRADVRTLPSAKEQEAYLRPQIYDGEMKKLIKQYPGTKYAALAEWDMIDNKLCGDWQGSSKCPEKEADIYEKYAKEHSGSPAAAQALYDAAWRRSALIEIYKTEEQAKKSEEAKNRAIGLAQQVVSQYAQQTDWAARAQRLIFLVQQNIPTYGNVTD